MNNRKIARIIIPFFALIVIIINSCTDDPLKVGIELLPDVDLINADADTLSIECFSVKGIAGYAVNPDNASTVDNAPIGQVIDPVFGETTAEVIMELKFNSENYYQINKHDTVDTYISCKLYLNINKDLIYGGDNGFDVDIYPLTRQLSYNNRYSFPTDYVMKSEDFLYNENPVSVNTIHGYQANNDSIEGIDSGKYYLVVELDKEFAGKFMDTAYLKKNDIYSSDFLEYYPGFYLRPKAKNSVGGLNNFFYSSSRLVLEYNRTITDTTGKSGNPGENDTTYSSNKYSTFSVNNYNCLYRNSSNYSPSGPLGTVLGDTVNQGDMFYVQSLGGVRGFIKIPQLNNLKTKADSLGINYAELVFPLNNDNLDTVNFFNPPRLSIFLVDSSGYTFAPTDLSFGEYFKGRFDVKTMDYRINITEFVHQYISSEFPVAGMYLMAPYNSGLSSTNPLIYKFPGRVVLNSGANNINPSFLRIIYTKTY